MRTLGSDDDVFMSRSVSYQPTMHYSHSFESSAWKFQNEKLEDGHFSAFLLEWDGDDDAEASHVNIQLLIIQFRFYD